MSSVGHGRNAWGAGNHAWPWRHRPRSHGNHAGRLDDFLFEFFLNAALFPLLQNLLTFLGSDEAGMDVEAEDNRIVNTGSC